MDRSPRSHDLLVGRGTLFENLKNVPALCRQRPSFALGKRSRCGAEKICRPLTRGRHFERCRHSVPTRYICRGNTSVLLCGQSDWSPKQLRLGRHKAWPGTVDRCYRWNVDDHFRAQRSPCSLDLLVGRGPCLTFLFPVLPTELRVWKAMSVW